MVTSDKQPFLPPGGGQEDGPRAAARRPRRSRGARGARARAVPV